MSQISAASPSRWLSLTMLSMVEVKTTTTFPTSLSLHECAKWTVFNFLSKANLCVQRATARSLVSAVSLVGLDHCTKQLHSYVFYGRKAAEEQCVFE
jgi:hypothetical protein